MTRLFPRLILFVGLMATVGSSLAEPRVVKYPEIPAKFEQYQDEQGFLWQVNKEGSLTSGETQYLPSGMKLFINGKAFAPASATLNDDSANQGEIDLALSQKIDDSLAIDREYWFDLNRGGVRVLDTIKNSGKTAKIKVEYKTAFQFPWQNLVGTSGGILGGNPTVGLGDRDLGVTVKFAVADGRQDTVILFRGGNEDKSPVVSASSNSRELILSYNVEIPAGKSVSLVHWIFRRNIGKIDEISGMTRAFHERRQLINSRVPEEITGSVHNFAPGAFPDLSGPPPNLDRLVALNELLGEIGVERKNEDILWVSPNNQLAGKIDPKAVVKIEDISVPIANVAAIQGGGGIGRQPRVFLRDGSILVGNLKLENFSLSVSREWGIATWDPAELNLLLLALGRSDGVAPPKTKAFVELRSGEVFAVSGTEEPIEMLSVWGGLDVGLDNLKSLQYLSSPRPEYRLGSTGGSSLGVLLAQDTISFVEASGVVRPTSSRSISRIRGVESDLPDVEWFGQRWFEVSDVPKELMPENGFLLQGNNLLTGGFSPEEKITVIDGGSSLDIDPSHIQSMRKIDQSSRSALSRFEIELANGDVIQGGIRQVSVRIGAGETFWPVPLRHMIAFQMKGGSK